MGWYSVCYKVANTVPEHPKSSMVEFSSLLGRISIIEMYLQVLENLFYHTYIVLIEKISTKCSIVHLEILVAI